jgi:hypothetical protein
LISASHSALDTIIDMVDTYLGEDEAAEGMSPAFSLDFVAEIELSEAVEEKQAEVFVSSFVSSVEENEEISEPDNDQDSEHMAFFKHLVLSGGISLDDFKEQAKNKGKLHQAYLTELNDELL